MRRIIFVKAVAKYHKLVTKSLRRKGQDDNIARESTQEAVMTLLKNKSYVKLEGDNIDHSVLSYLKDAARKTRANVLRKRARESSYEYTFEENDSVNTEPRKYTEFRDVERDPTECPFCHTPESLNHFGACGKCNTILPGGLSIVEKFSVDETDLLTEEDLDMKLDVQKAVSELSEQEQLVLNAVIHGTETLEEIAVRQDVSLSGLWRLYVKAKAKLATRLVEYAFQK